MSLRSGAASAVRRAALLTDRMVATRPGVTVLIYHRVGGGTDSPVDLPAAQFRAQVEHLAAHHRVLSLDDATASLAAGTPLNGVVITFDDGTTDVVDVAVPILAEAGLPSTLYLVTSAPGAGLLPWGAPAASWAAVADAAAGGRFTVASHTHDHRLLHRTSAAEAAEQLDRSIDAITEHLGTAPAHFAYPKAVPGNRAARTAVAARFRSAALAGHGANRTARHLQHLRRVPVSRGDDLAMFAVKAAGGLRLEGALRHLAATPRYWNRTT